MIRERIGQKVPPPLDRLAVDMPLNRVVVQIRDAGTDGLVSHLRSATERGLEKMAAGRQVKGILHLYSWLFSGSACRHLTKVGKELSGELDVDHPLKIAQRPQIGRFQQLMNMIVHLAQT